jgi:hypothetical protein
MPIMKLDPESGEQMSYWQRVFSRSIVNGAPYHDARLPVSNWDWPKDTFLQRRRSRGEFWKPRHDKQRSSGEATA